MSDVVAIVVRVIVGALSVVAAFAVLDAIHDRNTEIVGGLHRPILLLYLCHFAAGGSITASTPSRCSA